MENTKKKYYLGWVESHKGQLAPMFWSTSKENVEKEILLWSDRNTKITQESERSMMKIHDNLPFGIGIKKV